MISFDTRVFERSIRGLRRFREDAPNIIAEEFVSQVKEFAASGRNPDGTAWKPLTREYARRKQAKYGNALANKRATGALLITVKNRSGVIAPSQEQMAKAKGLEKKRKSFEPSPLTAQNIERVLLKLWNKV